MELSDPKIKKFAIFSQKKDFLIFWERETSKKLFIFMETELSYISGNGTFRARKIKKKKHSKKPPIFQEREFSSSKL